MSGAEGGGASEAIVFVELCEFVAASLLDRRECREMDILLLLKDGESLLVFAEARLEALLLSLAEFGSAHVKTAAAELVGHLSEFVPSELAVRLRVDLVAEVSARDGSGNHRLAGVLSNVFSKLSHLFLLTIN